MRIFIDTNVLISAALNAEGIPFRAYVKAASYPNRGLICKFARLIFVLIFARFKGIEKKLITISLSPTNFKLRF